MAPNPEKLTRKVGILSAIGTLSIGIAGIIGWVSGFYLTMSIPGIAPISPVSAVAYVLLGLIMVVLIVPVKNKNARTGAMFLNLFIMVIGCMFWLFAALFPAWDLQMIIVYPLVGNSSPVETGIAPLAAFAIFLATITLTWNVHHWIKWRHYATLMGVLATVVFAIGFMSLLGYAFGTPQFYGESVKSVSLGSSLALFFLGLGIISINGTKIWPSSIFSNEAISSQIIRVLIPVVVIAFICFSWVLFRVVIPSASQPIEIVSIFTVVSIVVIAYAISFVSFRIQRIVDKAQSDRQASIEALKRANGKLDILDSITRHDIMNKISASIVEAQILKRMSKDSQVQETADNIERNGNSIINMLKFSKEYRHIGVESPKWVNVKSILSEAAGQVDFTGCELLDTNCTKWRIFADPMIEKAFINILDNSIRHGGRVTSIIVECISRNDDGTLRIVLSDNGAGISEMEKRRIFEKGVGKNTGLGLFLVREILSITGLSIQENGVPSKGARFEIIVPNGKFEAIS